MSVGVAGVEREVVEVEVALPPEGLRAVFVVRREAALGDAVIDGAVGFEAGSVKEFVQADASVVGGWRRRVAPVDWCIDLGGHGSRGAWRLGWVSAG